MDNNYFKIFDQSKSTQPVQGWVGGENIRAFLLDQH